MTFGQRLVPHRAVDIANDQGTSVVSIGPGTVFYAGEDQEVMFGPDFAKGFLRRHVADRPLNDVGLCTWCDECVKVCPAEAIEGREKELRFDYDKCIRCYCCVEICPQGAMKRNRTALKRAIKAVANLWP